MRFLRRLLRREDGEIRPVETMKESPNLNRVLRLFFTLRKLPPEFADIDRLSLQFAVAAMFILAPLLFPGRHYFLYPILGMLIGCVGRVIGFERHFRSDAHSSSAPAPALLPANTIVILISLGAAVLLTLPLYWAWTTRNPIFLTQAFFAAIVLTFCIGQYWARRVAMGLLDILLLVSALVLYFHFLLPGFLAAAAFAGLVIWHFLFRKSQRPAAGQFSQPVKS